MTNDYSNLILNINKDLDGRIIFAVVTQDVNKPMQHEGIWYFPDEQSLRLYRLSHKNVIWLQECVDPKCKTCNGTGKIGKRIVQINQTTKELADFLKLQLEKSNEEIAIEIIKFLKLPINFKKPLEMLSAYFTNQLSDDNQDRISELFGKMIKQDFVHSEQLFCGDCFLPHYNKKLEETRRNIKFGIN